MRNCPPMPLATLFFFFFGDLVMRKHSLFGYNSKTPRMDDYSANETIQTSWMFTKKNSSNSYEQYRVFADLN